MPATAQILGGKVRENEMSGGTLRYKISDHMADLTVISTSIPRTLRSSFIITLSPAADCAPQRALPRSHWTCARPCPTPPGEQQQTPTPEGPLWIPHGFSPGRTHVSTATLSIFERVRGISSGPVISAAADVSPSFCRKSRIPCAVRSPLEKSKGRPGTGHHRLRGGKGRVAEPK